MTSEADKELLLRVADELDAAKARPTWEPDSPHRAAPVSPPAESGEVERLRSVIEEFPAHDFATDAEYLREIDQWWLKSAKPALASTPAPQPADHRRVQDAAPAWPELDALIAEAKAQAPQPGGAVKAKTLCVDALAQEIRRVDGEHKLGAGALAEALLPFISAAVASPSGWDAGAEANDWRERDLDLIATHEKAEAFEAGAKAMQEACAKYHDMCAELCRGANGHPVSPEEEAAHTYYAKNIRALPTLTPPAGEG